MFPIPSPAATKTVSFDPDAAKTPKRGAVAAGRSGGKRLPRAADPHRSRTQLSVIDAGCPQAALISRKASTTRRGIRCRETKALEMIPIVIGGAFRI